MFWTLLAATLAGLFLLPTRSGIDPDLFYLLAYGKQVIQNGQLPARDIFAFTPTKPVWYEHQWLTAMTLYWVIERWGDWGIGVIKLVLALSAFASLRAAQGRLMQTQLIPSQLETSASAPGPLASSGGNGSLALLFVLFVLNPAWFGNIRGLTFSATFFSFELWLIAYFVSQFAPLVISPAISAATSPADNVRRQFLVVLGASLLFLIWGNMHAEHLLGVFIWSGVVIVQSVSISKKQPMRHALALLLPFFMLLQNPWGFAFYREYLLPTATLCANQQHLADCRGPMAQWNLILPVVLLLVIAAFSKRRAMPGSLWLLFGMTALLAFRLERLQGYFFLTFAVLAPAFLPTEGLPTLIKRYAGSAGGNADRGARVVLACLSVFGMANLLAASPRIIKNDIWDFSVFPVREFELLAMQPPPADRSYRLLTDFDVGNYALWRLGPRYQVAVDGRYVNVYPEATIELASAAANPRRADHKQALSRLQPDFILYRREPGVSSPEDESSTGGSWKLCFSSPRFWLMCRPEFREAIQQAAAPYEAAVLPAANLRPNWRFDFMPRNP